MTRDGRFLRMTRQEAFDADPAPEGLPSAMLAVEHIEHHGRPLRHVGSSYQGPWAEHRFACVECDLRIEFRVGFSA